MPDHSAAPVRLVFALGGPPSPLITRARAILARDACLSVSESSSADQSIRDAIATSTPVLIVIQASAKEEIIAATLALRSNVEEIQHGPEIRVLIVSRFDDRRLAKSFMSFGAHEVLAESMADYAFIRKLRTHLSLLRPLAESAPRGPAPEGQPCELAQDLWLTGRRAKFRRSGLNLAFDAEGPHPDLGEWVLYDELSGQKKEQRAFVWRFFGSIHGEEVMERFPQEKRTGWIFRGQCPSFLSSTGKWRFLSPRPDLAYFSDGQRQGAKVQMLETEEAVIAADSDLARRNLKDLEELRQSIKALMSEATVNASNRNAIRILPEQSRDSASDLIRIQGLDGQETDQASQRAVREVTERPTGVNALSVLVQMSDRLARSESKRSVREWLVEHLRAELSVREVSWLNSRQEISARAVRGHASEGERALLFPIVVQENAPCSGWLRVLVERGKNLSSRDRTSINEIARELARLFGEKFRKRAS